MEIISISLAKKNNANVFNCVTDRGEYLLHSDIIVRNGIRVGEIGEDIFYASVDESARLICYNSVVKYIGAKVKTERQIRDYLYRKEYTKDVIDEVVEKLKEYKIIDDQLYTDMYVRSNPNYSIMKMKQKLFAGGVKSELVDKAIGEIDEASSALKNAEKFMKNKELSKENIDKLIRRLNYLGYGWDTIKNVLNKLKCDVEEI